MSYSRYKSFTEDGVVKLVPFIKIPKKNTDYYEYYKKGQTRLDLLSYKYYNDANYDWLILQANPSVGSLEFNIENNTLLRIPYPLEDTMSQYYSDIETYKELYGLD